MLVETAASDIVYSPLFTGVHGNYLKPSIAKAGLDPDNLPVADKTTMNFGSGGGAKSKAWRDIWGAGQGVGSINDVPSVAELVERLRQEYDERSEEHTSELQSLMRISYAVFCLKKKTKYIQ